MVEFRPVSPAAEDLVGVPSPAAEDLVEGSSGPLASEDSSEFGEKHDDPNSDGDSCEPEACKQEVDLPFVLFDPSGHVRS